jgi:hypothetical protein
METIEKIEEVQKMDITKFKEDIRILSEGQREFKNQRRTVRMTGSRTMSPSEATWKHQMNREKLRLMYAAYGLMRGKSFNQIENKHKEEGHPLNDYKMKIGKIISSYVLEAKGVVLTESK